MCIIIIVIFYFLIAAVWRNKFEYITPLRTDLVHWRLSRLRAAGCDDAQLIQVRRWDVAYPMRDHRVPSAEVYLAERRTGHQRTAAVRVQSVQLQDDAVGLKVRLLHDNYNCTPVIDDRLPNACRQKLVIARRLYRYIYYLKNHCLVVFCVIWAFLYSSVDVGGFMFAFFVINTSIQRLHRIKCD